MTGHHYDKYRRAFREGLERGMLPAMARQYAILEVTAGEILF